ncbi:hypothetical protein F383_38267 [Gossypium arboreum]|uniref:Uncharacterized protein n=1 Tax=Gossypium arboreum TaxID=29729 RepID=A0A0B0MHX6_GOSAR|nr:hypothetical protein F383_38267 [Gossypium arboreum]
MCASKTLSGTVTSIYVITCKTTSGRWLCTICVII